MSMNFDAQIEQNGGNGYADIILTFTDTANLSGSERILLSRKVKDGVEYLDGDSGTFSGKDTPLKCQGRLIDNRLTFTLEPCYVNNLPNGLYILTLVDADSNNLVLGMSDLYIGALRKLAHGSTYILASDKTEQEVDESLESLEKIRKNAASCQEELIPCFEKNITRLESSEQNVNAALQEGNIEKVQTLIATYSKDFENVKKAYESVKSVCDNTVSLSKNSKLMMDTENGPIALNITKSLTEYLEPYFKQYEELLVKKSHIESQLNALNNTSLEDSQVKESEPEVHDASLLANDSITDSLNTEKAVSPKKSSTALIIGIVVAAVVLCGAVGAYFLVNRDTGANPEPQVEKNEPQPKTSTAEPKAQTPAPKDTASASQAESKPLTTKERVARFLKDTARTPQKAMELLDTLEINSSEDQDAAFKLIYFAAMRDDREGIKRYAECLDPRTKAFGSIRKDAVESYEYYGKINDNDAKSALKAYLDEQSGTDAKAKEWLMKIK